MDLAADSGSPVVVSLDTPQNAKIVVTFAKDSRTIQRMIAVSVDGDEPTVTLVDGDAPGKVSLSVTSKGSSQATPGDPPASTARSLRSPIATLLTAAASCFGTVRAAECPVTITITLNADRATKTRFFGAAINTIKCQAPYAPPAGVANVAFDAAYTWAPRQGTCLPTGMYVGAEIDPCPPKATLPKNVVVSISIDEGRDRDRDRDPSSVVLVNNEVAVVRETCRSVFGCDAVVQVPQIAADEVFATMSTGLKARFIAQSRAGSDTCSVLFTCVGGMCLESFEFDQEFCGKSAFQPADPPVQAVNATCDSDPSFDSAATLKRCLQQCGCAENIQKCDCGVGGTCSSSKFPSLPIGSCHANWGTDCKKESCALRCSTKGGCETGCPTDKGICKGAQCSCSPPPGCYAFGAEAPISQLAMSAVAMAATLIIVN
jgi:hypothetical protein